VSGPFTEDPRLPAVDLVPLYREMLAIHAGNPEHGYCVLCGQDHCDLWRFAYGELVRAGEPLDAGPELQ
jgi:hypothetical protein